MCPLTVWPMVWPSGLFGMRIFSHVCSVWLWYWIRFDVLKHAHLALCPASDVEALVSCRARAIIDMSRTVSVGRLLKWGPDRRGAALPVQRIFTRLQCLGLGARLVWARAGVRMRMQRLGRWLALG